MDTKYVKAFDGMDIFMTKDAVQNPTAVVVIVLGLAEHSGRYDYVTKKLNETQLSVYRFDLRGMESPVGQGETMMIRISS